MTDKDRTIARQQELIAAMHIAILDAPPGVHGCDEYDPECSLCAVLDNSRSVLRAYRSRLVNLFESFCPAQCGGCSRPFIRPIRAPDDARAIPACPRCVPDRAVTANCHKSYLDLSETL